MANSGGAENALEYYYRALELNPGYIRARWVEILHMHFTPSITRLDLTLVYPVSI